MCGTTNSHLNGMLSNPGGDPGTVIKSCLLGKMEIVGSNHTLAFKL